MIQQVHRTDLEQLGLETKEIDRFMNLIDLMKRNTKINIQINHASNKKMLILKFIAGPLKSEILLDPDNMPIQFGKAAMNAEAGQQKFFVDLQGDKICSHHFQIDYDKIKGTLMLRNLNLDPEQSCGLYKMLQPQEHHNLQPGDAFRIGTLEFVVERFNTGIISDIGQRDHMEDKY